MLGCCRSAEARDEVTNLTKIDHLKVETLESFSPLQKSKEKIFTPYLTYLTIISTAMSYSTRASQYQRRCPKYLHKDIIIVRLLSIFCSAHSPKPQSSGGLAADGHIFALRTEQHVLEPRQVSAVRPRKVEVDKVHCLVPFGLAFQPSNGDALLCISVLLRP